MKVGDNTNSIDSIGVGKQFTTRGLTYVRIPEMNLQCEAWGFVVNCIRVTEDDPESKPPVFHAEFLLPETVVELVDEKCHGCERLETELFDLQCERQERD